MEEFKDWFVGYAQSFKSDDVDFQRNIVMKEKHTLRVCQEILALGKKLGLNDGDLSLAEVIALFHDIGRFEQYARYRTFVDSDSEDHAALGVKILEENNLLVGLNDREQSLILRSISYHNRASLPREESGKCLFFTKLLRDSDKLDIWKVVIDYYRRKDGRRNAAIELSLPDTPGISNEVYEALMQRHIVDAARLNNLNDFKLLQVGWVYCINFPPTFHCIKERKYLETIRAYLPQTKKIDNIFTAVQSYLNEKRTPIN